MTRSPLRKLPCAWIVLFGACICTAFGQQTVPYLPDAPSSQLALNGEQTGSGSSGAPANADAPSISPAKPVPVDDTGGQTKRILYIIPNFRSVSANQHLPPQSVKEKFVTASQDSFDYSSVLVPALLAGYNQARNQTPEFHQGAAGYGRYFWHSFVDQTSENYFVEFIVPVVAHEDTRYYTLGSGGFLKRSGYALEHVVVTRNDGGKNVFNSGEVVGAGIAAGVSNLYYPSRERTFSNTAQQWATSVGIDAFTFVFREFWPDINHALFHGAPPNAH